MMNMSHSFILSAAIRGKDLYLPYELDEKEANISDLKRVSFWHGVSRFFKTGSAAKQDIRVANVFLRTISSMQNNSVQDPLIIEAAKTYCEAHKKFKDLPFKRLRNFLYAHHCSELIGINIEDLVDDNGDAKNELLEFLRKNNLHRIIPEVNEEIKNSSILFNEEGKIFIRSVDGDSFLESKEQVKVILQNIKENDSGYKELNDLLNAYQRLEELENKLKRQSQAGNSKFTLFTMYVLNSLVPANRANFDLILKELKDSNEYPHLIEKYELDKNEHDRDLLIMYYFIEKNCDTAKKLFYDEMQRLEHSEDIPCEYRDAFERYPSHLKKEIEEQKIKILAMKEKLSE